MAPTSVDNTWERMNINMSQRPKGAGGSASYWNPADQIMNSLERLLKETDGYWQWIEVRNVNYRTCLQFEFNNSTQKWELTYLAAR